MLSNSFMTKEAITIVTPVYNDWTSFKHLVEEVDRCLNNLEFDVTIIAVDDGSSQTSPVMGEIAQKLNTIRRIEILHLSRNIGHQRAIAIGLSYVEKNCKSDGIVVMDADGEDSPDTLPALIAELHKSNRIVFARRGNRRENRIFLLFYHIYRSLFFVLTGKWITFGNYSVIPGNLLKRVVFLPEIWNHFAAGIMRAEIPQTTLLISRGSRYAGKSKMNFVGLILHGLSAISVYADILAVRLILFTAAIIFSTIIGSIVMLYIRFFTDLAIPGWATSVALGLGIILFQALMFLSMISFLVLNSRSTQMFIPFQHYEDFLLAKETIYEQS